jgi:tetratricopeptide (TPR) repeat protein
MEWETAHTLYQALARAAPAEIEFGLGLARVQQRIGSPAQVFATLAALRRLPAPAGQDLRIDEAEAAMATMIHDFPRAAAAARRAADSAERQQAWFRAAESRAVEGNALSATGPDDLAVQRMEAALRLYERVGDRASRGRALLLRGHLHWWREERDAAERAYRESATLSGQAGARREEGLAHFALSHLLGQAGDLRVALAEAERYLAIGHAIGHRGFQQLGLVLTARWRSAQGSYAAAAADLERALPITRALGNPRDTAAALDQLGRVRLDQGDFAAARRHFGEALALAPRGDRPEELGVGVELQLVALELAEGRVDRAAEQMAAIRARHADLARPEAFALQANVALARGDLAAARAAARVARERSRALPEMGALLQVEILEGRLLAASRRSAERSAAHRLLDATIGRARAAGWFAAELEARLALVEVHLGEQAPADARRELDTIREMIERRGAHRWSGALDQLSADADRRIISGSR